jgi:hypothetical protein
MSKEGKVPCAVCAIGDVIESGLRVPLFDLLVFSVVDPKLFFSDPDPAPTFLRVLDPDPA